MQSLPESTQALYTQPLMGKQADRMWRALFPEVAEGGWDRNDEDAGEDLAQMDGKRGQG